MSPSLSTCYELPRAVLHSLSTRTTRPRHLCTGSVIRALSPLSLLVSSMLCAFLLLLFSCLQWAPYQKALIMLHPPPPPDRLGLFPLEE